MAALLEAGAGLSACSQDATVSTEREARARIDAATALNSETAHYGSAPSTSSWSRSSSLRRARSVAFVTRSSSGSLEGCCTIFPRVELAGVPGDPAANWSAHVYVVEPSADLVPDGIMDLRLIGHDPGPKLLGSFTVDRTSPRGGPARSEA